MGVHARQQVVAAGVPVKLLGDSSLNGTSGLLRNLTATATIYVGGPDLAAGAPPTNAYGWLAADGPLSVDLDGQDQLWAVLATGGPSQTVEILAATFPGS